MKLGVRRKVLIGPESREILKSIVRLVSAPGGLRSESFGG